jgi:hypothetical protein
MHADFAPFDNFHDIKGGRCFGSIGRYFMEGIIIY